MVILAGGEERGVNEAAAAIAPEEDAAAIDDRRARGEAAGEVGIRFECGCEPSITLDLHERLELIGTSENAIALDDRHIHAVRAAGVAAEGAAEAVTEVAAG